MLAFCSDSCSAPLKETGSSARRAADPSHGGDAAHGRDRATAVAASRASGFIAEAANFQSFTFDLLGQPPREAPPWGARRGGLSHKLASILQPVALILAPPPPRCAAASSLVYMPALLRRPSCLWPHCQGLPGLGRACGRPRRAGP